ncbi:DNA cytosine methyltransferase [Chloroflexota bacterium]
MSTIKLVSLFSGAGGLEIGFKEAGFHTVFATDVWETSCDTHKQNEMADEVICIDIKKIDFTKLNKTYGQIDCVIGGPPCPPYSQTRHYLINKKGGLDDESTGFAIAEFLRAVKELQPRVYFFENVDGFAFKTYSEALKLLKRESEALGYNITYGVVNCANYGVPQTRKRFLCVGSKKDLPVFEFPPETHSDSEKNNGKLPWVTCREAIGEFDNITPEEELQRPGSKDYDLFKNIPPGGNYLFYTAKRGHPNPVFKWKSRYWTFLLKLSPDRPSWTIQASFSNNQGPFHWRNRFLRIEETKRLQTFPDSYVITGSPKEQWRQVGNAVPPLMAHIVAKKIMGTYFL